LVQSLLDQVWILSHLSSHLLLFCLHTFAKEAFAFAYHAFELPVNLQQHHHFLDMSSRTSRYPANP